MTITSALFSGVSKEDFQSWLVRDYPSAPENFIPPEEFLQVLHSSSEQPQNLVWLYRAPWHILSSLDTSDSQKWLEGWFNQQTEILNCYHNRLHTFKVINIDATASRQLLQDCETTDISTLRTTEIQNQSLLLPTLFSEFAPKYWDVFEALESISWLPEGEPIFRQFDCQVSEKDLFVFFNDLLKKNRLPSTELQLLNAQKISADSQKQLAYERSARYQAESDLVEIRDHFTKVQRDLELMVEIQKAQLEQFSQDLAHQELENVQYKEIIASSRSILVKANLLLEDSANNV
jgi:hypothetical protein